MEFTLYVNGMSTAGADDKLSQKIKRLLSMKEIYLDNNATTRVAPEVQEVVMYYMDKLYGNSSSLHKKGIEGERALKEARRKLAEILDIKEREVYFTSGATESNNLAVKGIAYAHRKKGKHIVTSKAEHDSVLEACKFLEKEGFEVTYLPVDKYAQVSSDDLEKAVRRDTILVAIMHVNNELGTIYPINELAKIAKLKNPDAVFFSDGAQAFGKMEVNLENIDIYSFSAHKIHGPKGVGVFVGKEGVKITPLFHGGGQENGMRSGTENTPGVVGLSRAAELAYKNLSGNLDKIRTLRGTILDILDTNSDINNVQNVQINSPEDGLPTTLNIAFPGIPAEVLLHTFEEKGIYVSTGSACSTSKDQTSHVLEAAGLSKEVKESSLRLGFSRYNTEEEVEYVVEVLKEAVPRLREVTTRNK